MYIIFESAACKKMWWLMIMAPSDFSTVRAIFLHIKNIIKKVKNIIIPGQKALALTPPPLAAVQPPVPVFLPF